MAFARVKSRGCLGLHAPLVTVEVDISPGLPKFSMVGLAELAVKESKDRVRSAINNNGFFFPNRRLTVNLAPADLPKEGGRYDLAIALGILIASGQLPGDQMADYEFFGELSLAGELRAVSRIITALKAAKRCGQKVIVPEENSADAAWIDVKKRYSAKHLASVCDFFSQGIPLPEIKNYDFCKI